MSKALLLVVNTSLSPSQSTISNLLSRDIKTSLVTEESIIEARHLIAPYKRAKKLLVKE